MAPGWQRRYNLLVLAEVVAIALVAATLGRLERPELIPMAICLIVGLHFLPLGSMFDMPAYRWTAAGLTTVALAGVALVPLEGADTARAGVGIAAALVLWATGIWLTRPQGNVVRGG
jgi:hypothetical protein